MNRRLVILTEIIAPYRIPVFNALAKSEGIDLHVIFLAENDPTLRQWRVYKHEIRFSYQVLPSQRGQLGQYNLLFNWGLRAALRRASPGALICGGYNYIASWQAMAWARRHRIPFLLWIESTAKDLRRNSALVEALKTKFMRGCDAFIVPGRSSFEYVKQYGPRQEVIFTAPNAVDIEFFAGQADMARREATARRPAMGLPSRYFLFVGRLVPEKGVFDLLQAYEKLAPELRTEIGLVFVGDGVARKELSNQAAAIAPGSVTFTGFVQREELASYYALAEMVILPTHTDAWGLVVNEAMACGLPVVCTEAAGCNVDLIKDRFNGRVVRTRVVSQLASAMEELARDAEMRLLMGERSRRRIRGFSPENCAAGITHAILSCGVPSYA